MRPPSRQAEQGAPPPVGPAQAACGSDYMVDVFRDLGIEYLAAVPGNTFKGLHESVVNYGMRSDPPLELLTCTHEEISVALCHGYAKAAGKPMGCVMHSTVGLQHGAMALYNAWGLDFPGFSGHVNLTTLRVWRNAHADKTQRWEGPADLYVH